MENIFIVAIDGHAGCGKSSICSQASLRMGWVYISTGALYRALGYLAKTKKINTEIENKLEELLENFCENTSWNEKSQSLFYKEINLAEHLVSEEIGARASSLAKVERVRERLLPLQRNLINSFSGRVVLVEGRDITSVVCPDAPLKIFMTATIEDRAVRRLKQLKEASPTSTKTLSELKDEIFERDKNDSTREIAPLLKTEDAIEFDTSGVDFETCVEKLSKLVSSSIK